MRYTAYVGGRDEDGILDCQYVNVGAKSLDEARREAEQLARALFATEAKVDWVRKANRPADSIVETFLRS